MVADPTDEGIEVEGAADDGGSSEGPYSADADGERVAAEVCAAMDPAVIEEEVAPVEEVQTIDDTMCNVVLG